MIDLSKSARCMINVCAIIVRKFPSLIQRERSTLIKEFINFGSALHESDYPSAATHRIEVSQQASNCSNRIGLSHISGWRVSCREARTTAKIIIKLLIESNSLKLFLLLVKGKTNQFENLLFDIRFFPIMQINISDLKVRLEDDGFHLQNNNHSVRLNVSKLQQFPIESDPNPLT